MMPKFFTALLSLTLAACFAGRSPEITADFVFDDVHVIPMDEEVILENRTVAIRDGVIVAIIDQTLANRISAPTRIDGQGRYMMPGLADMHVHIRWDPETMFNLFLANGVTTVFNMSLADGEGRYDHKALRARVQSGEMIGPRYLISGPQLHEEQLPDVSAVAPILDLHVAEKYDLVKVHGDLSKDVYDALIAGAHARDLRIGGHAQHLRPLIDSLQLDVLEHMEELLYVAPDGAFATATDGASFLEAYRANAHKLDDPNYRAELAQQIAATDTFVNPTLIVYATLPIWANDDRLVALRTDQMMRFLPDHVKKYWLSLETNPYQESGFPLTFQEIEENVQILLALTKDLHDAGVPLLTGTDGFGTLVPGFSLQKEFALLERAGLSPYEILRASTVNVAEYLGESETAGAIRVGYRADFVLLDSNPLSDISSARTVSGVMTNGRWISRSEVEAMIETAGSEY